MCVWENTLFSTERFWSKVIFMSLLEWDSMKKWFFWIQQQPYQRRRRLIFVLLSSSVRFCLGFWSVHFLRRVHTSRFIQMLLEINQERSFLNLLSFESERVATYHRYCSISFDEPTLTSLWIVFSDYYRKRWEATHPHFNVVLDLGITLCTVPIVELYYRLASSACVVAGDNQ